MPFVSVDRRFELDEKGVKAAEAPGDLCYLAYKDIMRRWKAEPRWTTIHEIRRAVEDFEEFGLDTDDLPPHFDLKDVYVAIQLAWEVFFYFHAIPYEIEKKELNGSIE